MVTVIPPIVSAKSEVLSDTQLLELFKRTEFVEPYTAEFNEIIRKLFPKDTKLQDDIRGSYRNTVRLLESAWRIHAGALTPELIIASGKNGGMEIQRIALLSSAAKNLFTRCQQLAHLPDHLP